MVHGLLCTMNLTHFWVMKIKQSTLILFSFAFCFTTYAGSVNDTVSPVADEQSEAEKNKYQKAFSAEATYLGDLVTNTTGGIRTGTVFLGMANLRLAFDTEAAGFWKGGSFFINGAATHGNSPSENLTGDFQVISNIDAGDHIYLHEFWFRQTFNRIEITLGLQDLNASFAASSNGGAFINSSFGIPPVISDNVPAPIFPLTAPGLTAKLSLRENIWLSAAIFDGCPTAFDHNEYNTRWHLNKNDGSLFITELQADFRFLEREGSYKAGTYYHSGLTGTNSDSAVEPSIFSENYGFYLLADQLLFKGSSGSQLAAFAQLAFSPAHINHHHTYLGCGLNYSGFSKSQPDDALGLAMAHAGFGAGIRKCETTFEMFYRKQICSMIFIQPDLQFIVNPAATDDDLPNALAAILRFGISF